MKKIKHYQYAPPLSKEKYAECLKTYREISDEWELMLTWIRDHFLKHLRQRHTFSILSVGCGSGEFDFHLIQILQSRMKLLEYCALEPNKVHYRQMKTNIATNPFHGVQFEVQPVPWEKFKADRQFDLVHLTHCLYYISDRERAIFNALNLTSDDGCILIFHHTPQGIHQIQQKFMKHVKGGENEMFSSREIQYILEHHHIPYQLDIIDSFLNVSECLRIDSESGQNLLSFFLECDAGQLAPELKQEIGDYIREISFSNFGSFFLFHPIAVFLIR
jgi:SAM-dependent methyltransferase